MIITVTYKKDWIDTYPKGRAEAPTLVVEKLVETSPDIKWLSGTVEKDLFYVGYTEKEIQNYPRQVNEFYFDVYGALNGHQWGDMQGVQSVKFRFENHCTLKIQFQQDSSATKPLLTAFSAHPYCVKMEELEQDTHSLTFVDVSFSDLQLWIEEEIERVNRTTTVHAPSAIKTMTFIGGERTNTYTLTFDVTCPDMQFLEIPRRLTHYFPDLTVIEHTNTSLTCNLTAGCLLAPKTHILNIIEPNENVSDYHTEYGEKERENFYDKIKTITITGSTAEQKTVEKEDSSTTVTSGGQEKWTLQGKASTDYNKNYLIKVFFNEAWKQQCTKYKWTPLRFLEEEIDNVYTDPDEYYPLFPIITQDDRPEQCVFRTEASSIGAEDEVEYIRESIIKAAKSQKCPTGIDEVVIRPVEKLYTQIVFREGCSDTAKDTAKDWLAENTYGYHKEELGHIELYEEGEHPYFTTNPPVSLKQTREEREAVIRAWIMGNLPMIKDIQVMLYV